MMKIRIESKFDFFWLRFPLEGILMVYTFGQFFVVFTTKLF